MEKLPPGVAFLKKGNTAQFSKKPQPKILVQFKVLKMATYRVYFPFSKLRK